MLGSTRNLRVYVYGKPADMRLGFDGLYALVREGMNREPVSGDVYLFIGKDRKRAKALLWDGTGLCLYCKRMERGRFAGLFEEKQGRRELTLAELMVFFEGSHQLGRISLCPPDYQHNLIAKSDTIAHTR